MASYNQINTRNEGSVKVISFNSYGGVHRPVERPGMSGLISQLSWGNPATMKALRELFSCNANEVIVAIEITDDGIKAKFETLE